MINNFLWNLELNMFLFVQLILIIWSSGVVEGEIHCYKCAALNCSDEADCSNMEAEMKYITYFNNFVDITMCPNVTDKEAWSSLQIGDEPCKETNQGEAACALGTFSVSWKLGNVSGIVMDCARKELVKLTRSAYERGDCYENIYSSDDFYGKKRYFWNLETICSGKDYCIDFQLSAMENFASINILKDDKFYWWYIVLGLFCTLAIIVALKKIIKCARKKTKNNVSRECTPELENEVEMETINSID